MSHGPTKYSPKDRCIYCGRTNLPLTDEHVVPLSLGGGHILQKASCKDCAAITSAFELEVARNLWGDARISYDAPTRHKKRARKTHHVLRDPNGLEADIPVPMNQYPGAFVFYTMGPAGILVGRDANQDLSGNWGFTSVVDTHRLEALEKAYPGRVTINFKHVPASFARLIAKIGYCQILCSLDRADFTPLCLEHILGKESNLSHVVGGRESAEPQSGIGCATSSHIFGTEDRAVIIAEVRLYANNHTPIYHVVVGEVVGEERVRRVSEKIEATYSVFLKDGYLPSPFPPLEFHWMPRIWPLIQRVDMTKQ